MKVEIGNRIKQLRLQKGITQDALAQTLNISYQTVSKWENGVSMPDIQLLPLIAVYFGCSIDDLFDLSEQDQFERIEHMLEMQDMLPFKEFEQAENFLKEKLEKPEKKADALRLLSELYNHRADGYRKKAEIYALGALEIAPEIKQNHHNLQRSQEGSIMDWNYANHSKRIFYYQQFIKKNPNYLGGYLRLMDELIADYRLEEASHICDAASKLDDGSSTLYYRGRIAWLKGEHKKAEGLWHQMLEEHKDEWLTYANMADGMAYTCRYDAAIFYYRKAQELQPSPKYTDCQIASAHIYEIQGKYDAAIFSLKEQLKILKNEWHITEGCEVERIHREISRLQNKGKQECYPNNI